MIKIEQGGLKRWKLDVDYTDQRTSLQYTQYFSLTYMIFIKILFTCLVSDTYFCKNFK